jgi:hypothetical protein
MGISPMINESFFGLLLAFLENLHEGRAGKNFIGLWELSDF